MLTVGGAQRENRKGAQTVRGKRIRRSNSSLGQGREDPQLLRKSDSLSVLSQVDDLTRSRNRPQWNERSEGESRKDPSFLLYVCVGMREEEESQLFLFATTASGRDLFKKENWRRQKWNRLQPQMACTDQYYGELSANRGNFFLWW